MKVADVMTQHVITVTPATPLKEVATLLVRNGIGGVAVVEDDDILGVVSETDLLYKERGPARPNGFLGRLLHMDEAAESIAKLDAVTAGEAMSSPAITIAHWEPVSAAAARMLEHDVNRLLVTQKGLLAGIVTRADLVRAFVRADDEIEREIREDLAVRAFSEPPGSVSVRVQDGHVTLGGRVGTPLVAELLPDAARRVPGVVSVDSDLSFVTRD